MSRLLKKKKCERLGFNRIEQIKQHPFFHSLNALGPYFATDPSLAENLKMDKKIESTINMCALSEMVLIKDYAKVFSFFCFYKIFRIKLFQDGLIQFCYPKEKRVWENFMVLQIKKMNIEGPKSLKIFLEEDEMISIEVFL